MNKKSKKDDNDKVNPYVLPILILIVSFALVPFATWVFPFVVCSLYSLLIIVLTLINFIRKDKKPFRATFRQIGKILTLIGDLWRF